MVIFKIEFQWIKSNRFLKTLYGAPLNLHGKRGEGTSGFE